MGAPFLPDFGRSGAFDFVSGRHEVGCAANAMREVWELVLLNPVRVKARVVKSGSYQGIALAMP
jgi:hypothetical protein